VRRGTLVVFVAALALGSACSRTKTLDAQQLDQKIASDMQAKLDLTGVTVSCPDDVKVQTGGTFTCTATGSDGKTMTLEVTQNDDRGNVGYNVVGEG